MFTFFFLQVSILDTGEVCMELLKCHSGQERVKEVLRISCNGSMVSSLCCTVKCPTSFTRDWKRIVLQHNMIQGCWHINIYLWYYLI